MSYLDEDSAEIFNRALPLSYWKRAQSSPSLPDHVRKELQRVIFVRTLLMSEAPPFDQVVPTTENIAREIWRRLEPHLREPAGRLHAIRLYETPDLFVDYFGEQRSNEASCSA